MGSFINKAQKHLPVLLHSDLSWLNKKVYTFAKHEYGDDVYADDLPESDAGKHLFTLHEAVMIYFIARKLVVSLEQRKAT